MSRSKMYLRRPIFIAFITSVLILTLSAVVWWGIEHILPILTPIPAYEVIFFIILVIVFTVIKPKLPLIFERLMNWAKGDPNIIILENELRKRNKENLLQLVWNTWVEGMLHKSSYNETFSKLESRSDSTNRLAGIAMVISGQQLTSIHPRTKILELFDNANGELLILGAPGSGKTTVLFELASQLISRTQQDLSQPIPVVFNLSSWTPKLVLAEWLVNELQQKYYIPWQIGRLWVEGNELLLLLDGLDEVKQNINECVKAINLFRERYRAPMVICSCRQVYETLETHLTIPGSVLISPLNDRQVRERLEEAGVGLFALSQEWERTHELWEFIKTPLILNILVTTYRNISERSLRETDNVRDFRQQVFNDYIAQMFKQQPNKSYTFEPTKDWLAWLAHTMVESGQSLFHIEDIRPSWIAVSKKRISLIGGLISGLIAGLGAGLFLVYDSMSVEGLIIGVTIMVVQWMIVGTSMDLYEPKEKLTWPMKSLSLGLFIGLPLGLIVETIVGLSSGKIIGLIAGLIAGLIVGPVVGLNLGLKGSEIDYRIVPGQGLRESMVSYVRIILIGGLISGLILGSGSDGLSTAIIFGLIAGLYIGQWYGGAFLIYHYLTRGILYRNGWFPVNIKSFLDYATDKGYLYCVGGGYIFVHRMLMEHFAEMYTGKETSKFL